MWGRSVVSLTLLLGLARVAGAGPAYRVYADGASGVSFSYPAGWLLNADDDAATAKLLITTGAQPLAVVQLEGNFADAGPYKGTDFEAGAFAYTVVPLKTQPRCFELLDGMAVDEQKPISTVWNGLPARKLEAKYGIVGTEDSHQVFATFGRGRCYLFETAIVSKSVGGPIRALALSRWGLIRTRFRGVMQSVRIGGSRGASGDEA